MNDGRQAALLKAAITAVLAVLLALPVHAQTRTPGTAQAIPEALARSPQNDPEALGRPLSFWLRSLRERDADIEMAFEAIFELGPEAWRAVPELTRIVAEPFAPIRIGKDSLSEMHAKLRNIHLRAGAIDGLGAIGEAAAPAARAVIHWGLTLKTVVPDERPLDNALLFDLIGIDVLERMRAAGTVAQFGPGAAGAVQELLESPDNEARKFSVAILNDAAVPIAAELMNSDSCKNRLLGLSILSGMWPVVSKDHLLFLGEFLECSEADPDAPTTIRRKVPSSFGSGKSR